MRRQTRDPRLTEPMDMLVIKSDNIYQIKREKIHDYQFLRFPFLTTVNGTQYRCSTYDFMSILTTGAINSYNEKWPNATAHSTCCLRFNDNEVFTIKGETRNIPIIKKQWFMFYNELGDGQSDQEGLETGYNDLIILLHNYPYDKILKKHNPTFCAETDVLAQDETQTFWIGVNRLAVGDDLLIPYLPLGYEYMHLCATGTKKNFTITIDQYMQSKCDSLQSVQTCTALYDGTDLGFCMSFFSCTDRYRLTVKNLDVEDDQIYLHGYFTGKSDNY